MLSRPRFLRRAISGFALPAAIGCRLLLLAASSRGSDEPTRSKGDYTLFSPTPASQLRELSPDRPDKTESPYTVDAGHFQLEMDFITYSRDESVAPATETWNFAPLNLKVGLSSTTDLQLVFDDYLRVSRKNGNAPDTVQSGVGDLTARLKFNLWGDDAGRTALALLPFVKAPTSSAHLGNGAVEGGVIVPGAIKLVGGWDLGWESAFSLLRNTGGHGYHGDFIESVTCDRGIAGSLSGYLEFFSDFSAEPHAPWIGSVDAGLEYALGKNVQLDCGCNFGVTRSAEAINPFTGITLRF